MKYRLVIWDFDGTMADTLSIALSVYNQLAEDKGFVPISDPQAVRDMSMKEFLKAHRVAAWRVPFLFSGFLTEMKKRSEELSLHEGIDATIRQIQDLGVTQAVVSSNDTEIIDHCLSTHGIRECFTSVVGTSKLFGKEHRLKQAMKTCATNSRSTLYVGDEIRDIEAANAVGADIAAVTWGLNSAKALSANNPTWLVRNPGDLVRSVLTNGAS